MKVVKNLVFNILVVASLSFLGISAALGSCQSKNFTITGKVDGIPDQGVYLKYYAFDSDDFENLRTFATTQIQNGIFEFTGEIKNAPIEFYIDFEKKMESPPNTPVYKFSLDSENSLLVNNNGKIEVLISKIKDQSIKSMPLGGVKYSQPPVFIKMEVKGSSIQDEYRKVESEVKTKYQNDIYRLYRELYTLPKEKKDSIGKVLATVTEKKYRFYKEYINENPNSIVAFKLYEKLDIDREEKEKIYESFSPQVKSSHIALLNRFYKELNEKQDEELKKVAEKVGIGKPYIDFLANDIDGKEVQFSSLINPGKRYILLDFWASWCGPCRAENPNVLKAYKKYKNSGFYVVALSLDKVKDKWEKAVEEENMPWKQLIDEEAFEGIAKKYAVTGIPNNFLIDCSTGAIVAKNLRGEALHKKLDELFQ